MEGDAINDKKENAEVVEEAMRAQSVGEVTIERPAKRGLAWGKVIAWAVLLCVGVGAFVYGLRITGTGGSVHNDAFQEIIESNDAQKIQQLAQDVGRDVTTVDPLQLYMLSAALFQSGSKQQGAFWFYVAQARTSPLVSELDPDQSGYPALRSALNYEVGGAINPWAASDVFAWRDLAERALQFESKQPIPEMPAYYTEGEEKWRTYVEEGRVAYMGQFTEAFSDFTADNGKSFNAQRVENELYVGPWQDAGPTLPEEWR